MTNTANTAAVTTAPRLPIAVILASKTNPRKTFDPKKLEELAASIKDHDVIQPILVRPLYKIRVSKSDVGEQWYAEIENKAGNWNIQGGAQKSEKAAIEHATNIQRYELVAGERRWRASKAAGLADIPATVRDLSDEQCLQIQVIENLQRDDLHPLEEAEGYEALMKLPGKDGKKHTADDIAIQVGKSKSYIYAKLKLLALCAEARKACFEGKINESIALLIARIPIEDLQRRALKEVLTNFNRGPMSYREAAEHVQRNYMLQLDQAPFDRLDAGLVPVAGPCGSCPKRTGNQKDLFGDVKSADVCTDPICFASKRDAHVIRISTAAEKDGKKVISGKKANDIFPYRTSSPHGGYRAGDDKEWLNGTYQSFAAALGKAMPASELVVNPHTMTVQEIYPEKTIKAALKAKGVKVGTGASSSGVSEKQKADKRKSATETKFREQLYLKVRESIKEGLTKADFALVATRMFDGAELPDCLMNLWDPIPEGKKKGDPYTRARNFQPKVAALSATDLCRFLVDCAISEDLHVNSFTIGRKKSADLYALAERYKVDPEPIRKAVYDEAKAKEGDKKKPAKKAAPVKAKTAVAKPVKKTK